MSLLAVQNLLRSKLDGWVTPAMETAQIAPFECYIAPPQVVVNTMSAPQVFLWTPGPTDIHRTTAPRQVHHRGGFKRAPWKVNLTLFFVDVAEPTDATLPILVDAVRWAVEDIVFPQPLEDLDSEPSVTQLIQVGERIDVDPLEPQPINEENMSHLLYACRFVVEMTEDYQS